MTIQKHQRPRVMHGAVVPIQMDTLDASGRFEGWATRYGVPIERFFGQVLMDPGMFGESIKRNGPENIRLLWQHNSDEPIGVYEQVEEVAEGVRVKGRLLIEDVQRAREAFALMKNRAIGGLSVGFDVEESFTDNKTGVVHYTKGDLMEVSAVTFPANAAAKIDRVHSLGVDEFQEIRDLERFLRDAGLSRNAAKAVASRGFAGLSQCEADEDHTALAEALQTLNQEIRKGIQ